MLAKVTPNHITFDLRFCDILRRWRASFAPASFAAATCRINLSVCFVSVNMKSRAPRRQRQRWKLCSALRHGTRWDMTEMQLNKKKFNYGSSWNLLLLCAPHLAWQPPRLSYGWERQWPSYRADLSDTVKNRSKLMAIGREVTAEAEREWNDCCSLVYTVAESLGRRQT